MPGEKLKLSHFFLQQLQKIVHYSKYYRGLIFNGNKNVLVLRYLCSMDNKLFNFKKRLININI